MSSEAILRMEGITKTFPGVAALTDVTLSVRRGEIPGFLEPLLRHAIEKAPLDQLIRGGISLRGLIG